MNAVTSPLADRLLQLGYDGLFLRFDSAALDDLWATPTRRAALERLSLDEIAPPAARFLAAEVLFHHQPDYPPEVAKAVLAPVYATALASETAVNGNSWGLPGTVDGVVGAHLLRFGSAAIDALAPLLADATRVFYEGSEEAEIGNDYQYRVKDVAAFLICQLLGWSYPIHKTPAERDREIDQVAARLARHDGRTGDRSGAPGPPSRGRASVSPHRPGRELLASWTKRWCWCKRYSICSAPKG